MCLACPPASTESRDATYDQILPIRFAELIVSWTSQVKRSSCHCSRNSIDIQRSVVSVFSTWMLFKRGHCELLLNRFNFDDVNSMIWPKNRLVEPERNKV